MHIGRAVIIIAILVLGVAGSVLAALAISAAAGHVTSTHMQVAATSHTVYHT